MADFESIANHYSIGSIVEAIETGLQKLEKSTDSVTVEDLSAVDEFHIGSSLASRHFFDQLPFSKEMHILDIGCGIGGASRFVANRFGSEVTGFDLTESYIQAGKILNRWVGLEKEVNLEVGNAISLKYLDESFDGAFTMHVLMNVADKPSAFAEAFRLIKPSAYFGIYDVTKYGDREIAFPVPWANDQNSSFLYTATEYVENLEAAGFEVELVNDRHIFALEFFEAIREKIKVDGPPPLGIHLLMGQDAKVKIENMVENLVNGLVAPFEIIARKPSA